MTTIEITNDTTIPVMGTRFPVPTKIMTANTPTNPKPTDLNTTGNAISVNKAIIVRKACRGRERAINVSYALQIARTTLLGGFIGSLLGKNGSFSNIFMILHLIP